MGRLTRPAAAHRLGLRLGALLALSGVAVVLLGGWFVNSRLVQAGRYAVEVDLDRRHAEVRAEIEQLAQEIDRALAVFAEVLGEERGAEGWLSAGDRMAAGLAPLWNRSLGLDWLTVIDSHGRIVSSARWPEQAGLLSPVRDLVAGRPATLSVATTDDEGLVLAVRRDIAVRGQRLALIGGRSLRVVAERVGSPVWVFAFSDEGGEPRLLASREPVENAATLQAAARAASRAEDATQRAAAGFRFRALAMSDPAGGVAGSVVVAADGSAVEARAGEIRRAFGVLAVLAGVSGLAAGWWAGLRLSRPVQHLVHAVDAIGSGQADYTFPRARPDEFAELEAAFSRMQRALALEVRRAVAAERLAAWRDVARHVAHEVKNPLAPIRLTVQNLERARRAGGAVFDELFEDGARTILEEVVQLERLVGEFSEFARLPEPVRRRLELAPLVDDVLELYASEPGLEIVRHYSASASWVDADADQMSRAVKNIVANAVESMRGLPPGAPRRIEVAIAVAGETVTLRVRDHGAGLAPGARERMFEPYFTTKSGGVGLGLAITHRIVTEHGGAIAAEPGQDGGTEVEIRLSVAREGSAT